MTEQRFEQCSLSWRGVEWRPSMSEVLSSILIVRHSPMQRPRPAARLPAHATFSMLKHAERLIQRPAESSMWLY